MDITLLNGEVFEKDTILEKMMDDSFYYGYLGKHALSSSSCKSLLEGPSAYQEMLDTPPREKEPQAFRDGRLIHLMSLEPHRVNDMVFVDSTKGSNLYKQTVLDNPPQTVYTNRERARCQEIADAVLDNDQYREMVRFASFEKPAISYYKGVPFRGKADMILPGVVMDLKTTSDITKFDESANMYNYDLQAALYLHLFDAYDFKYAVVDKRTKVVKLIEFDQEFIDSGYRKLDMAVENYHAWKVMKDL